MLDIGSGVFDTAEADQLLHAVNEVEGAVESLSEFADAEYVDYSTESLNEVLRSIGAKQSEFTTSVRNLFKIGGKSFITEYDVWAKKNSREIKKVERMDYGQASEHDVDVPTGMQVTYTECLNLIDKIVTNHDVVSAIGILAKAMDSILISIEQGNDDCERAIKSTISKLVAINRPIEQYHEKLVSSFDSSSMSMEQVNFGKMFANMSELVEFRKHLGAVNKIAAKLRPLADRIDMVEARVGECVDYVVDDSDRTEDQFRPSSKFVKSFAKLLGEADRAISMHGDASLRLMALTHNTTFVYSTLGGK